MDTSIAEFVPLASFDVKGRGTVYTGKCPYDLKAGETLVGRNVIVAGKVMEIRAVERFAVARPDRKGDDIGFILAPAALDELGKLDGALLDERSGNSYGAGGAPSTPMNYPSPGIGGRPEE